MDGLVADAADNQGLAAAGCHPFDPRGVHSSTVDAFLARLPIDNVGLTNMLSLAAVGYLAESINNHAWTNKILAAVAKHRQGSGGYSALPELPADIISTRAAVAIHTLFRQSVPQQPTLESFVTRCMDKAEGFDAVPPGTIGASSSTRSLLATWSGVSVLQRLSEAGSQRGSWLERAWGVGSNTQISAMQAGM